jgi:hypothetical protein
LVASHGVSMPGFDQTWLAGPFSPKRRVSWSYATGRVPVHAVCLGAMPTRLNSPKRGVLLTYALLAKRLNLPKFHIPGGYPFDHRSAALRALRPDRPCSAGARDTIRGQRVYLLFQRTARSQRFASELCSVEKEGRDVTRAPVLLFVTANRRAGLRRDCLSGRGPGKRPVYLLL